MFETHTLTLVKITCCKCGILFGVPRHWRNKRKEDHNGFYCPNGHCQYFSSDSDVERLEKQNKQLEARNSHLNDQLESTQKSRNAYMGHLNRTKKRIAAGVCPCCRRTFQNVAKHMANQHPSYNRNKEITND